MWYRFEKGNPIGIPRIRCYKVAFYDMTNNGKCFDETCYYLEDVHRVMPFVETVEDIENDDRTRVFAYFDNGDMYELKLEKVDNERDCSMFYG